MRDVMVLGRCGYWIAGGIITISFLLGALRSPLAAAEPQPGDTLNQASWQQAKSLLPEGIIHRFEDGSYQAQIVTLPTATNP